MARHNYSSNGDMTFPIVVLVGAVAWAHQAELMRIAHYTISGTSCMLLIHGLWRYFINWRTRLKDVDTLSGIAFEHYVADLLRSNGYGNVSLTEKYDYGVDIVAEKDGIRWGVQVKHYSGLVKADAVRQVVTGLRMYNCDRAMVITNSTYSVVAHRLAEVNDCTLIDRAGLKQLKSNRGAIL